MGIWHYLKNILVHLFCTKESDFNNISNGKVGEDATRQSHLLVNQMGNIGKEKCNNCMGTGKTKAPRQYIIQSPTSRRFDTGAYQDNSFYEKCPCCKGKGYLEKDN